eukprot:1607484-Alexandrium_andersonii.AAC.1
MGTHHLGQCPRRRCSVGPGKACVREVAMCCARSYVHCAPRRVVLRACAAPTPAAVGRALSLALSGARAAVPCKSARACVK